MDRSGFRLNEIFRCLWYESCRSQIGQRGSRALDGVSDVA